MKERTQAKRSSRTTSFPEGMEAPLARGWGACPGEIERKPPCAARQDGAPPPQPRGLHSVLQQKWHRLCLRLRKASEEMGRLIGPLTASLSSQDHQTGSSTLSHQLRVCGLFPAPRFLQSHAGAPWGSPPRLPPERRHQRGVYCQLCSLPQGQPVCDHLDPSSIEAMESSHVEVTHEDVGGHPSPSLAAHLGCSTLKRTPRFGQTGRVGGHMQGQAEASAQQDAERLASLLVILLVGIVVKTG